MLFSRYAAVVLCAVLAAADAEEVCEAQVMHRGFLIDTYCWDLNPGTRVAYDGSNLLTNPEDHKVMCMKLTEPPCVQGGYSLMAMNENGTYYPMYKLDTASNQRALAMLEATTKEDNYFVHAVGGSCYDDATPENKTFSIAGGDEDFIECEPFSHTGYLIDTYCWDLNPDTRIAYDGSNLMTNPEDHKVMCMKLTEPPCIQGGYSLMDMNEDGTYYPKYKLDDASNGRALAMLEATTKEDDYQVSVEGYVCGDSDVVTIMSMQEIDSNITPTPSPVASPVNGTESPADLPTDSTQSPTATPASKASLVIWPTAFFWIFVALSSVPLLAM